MRTKAKMQDYQSTTATNNKSCQSIPDLTVRRSAWFRDYYWTPRTFILQQIKTSQREDPFAPVLEEAFDEAVIARLALLSERIV